MEYKSHKVRTTNLPDDKLIYRITDKSNIALVLCWIITLILFILRTPFVILALFYSLAITLKKDRVIFAGYRRFFVSYIKNEDKYCDIYYLSEIGKWTYYSDLLNPKIKFVLRDGEEVTITNGVDRTMYRYFKKVMGKKEDKIVTVRHFKDVL